VYLNIIRLPLGLLYPCQEMGSRTSSSRYIIFLHEYWGYSIYFSFFSCQEMVCYVRKWKHDPSIFPYSW